MKRYFVWIQYNGTRFSGWQSQPNAPTIQDLIESKLSMVQREEIRVVGCGRTDAGVHASDYVFHFDGLIEDVDHLIFKLNRMLGKDVAVIKIREVLPTAHARFDAIKRSYGYHISQVKNPFKTEVSYHNLYVFQKDLEILNRVAAEFLKHDDFFPYCKSNSDVNNTKCHIYRSEWEIHNGELIFHVEANRFLRGMVRLLVGSCLNVANGKLSIDEIKDAFNNQRRLSKDLSVPAHGLFLNKITYPDDLFV
ncbi:tRNA pseudouridine(38-40) synthase TruA [Portibacter lacus]|uniref:tRNA pseudouridine synthase A n=1 Tax=Portibacter lacus TaxID=1099794 RepID=A0AA37WGC0_9BACT|nr:tRNA pseudouridine(38-40) synthase TruA [Portibacter lacus]GLR19738.1 tRNA pseudouridine synthase A [Portibacter lacus]